MLWERKRPGEGRRAELELMRWTTQNKGGVGVGRALGGSSGTVVSLGASEDASLAVLWSVRDRDREEITGASTLSPPSANRVRVDEQVRGE